ncbi:hypothetical protein AK51_13340 [Serratia nematodiphila DZ0503SBS1]|nr:hypothetical protein AK51_13340 [Serratia nematodiphila DZ0503SBS1]
MHSIPPHSSGWVNRSGSHRWRQSSQARAISNAAAGGNHSRCAAGRSKGSAVNAKPKAVSSRLRRRNFGGLARPAAIRSNRVMSVKATAPADSSAVKNSAGHSKERNIGAPSVVK